MKGVLRERERNIELTGDVWGNLNTREERENSLIRV